MNRAAVHLATEGTMQGIVHMEEFYRKKGGARELLAKGKKGFFLGQDIFFGKEKAKVLSYRSHLLPLGSWPELKC